MILVIYLMIALLTIPFVYSTMVEDEKDLNEYEKTEHSILLITAMLIGLFWIILIPFRLICIKSKRKNV